MSNFFKVRLATMTYGFVVMYLFTGDLGVTGMMGSVIFIGNTLIMWALIK